MCKECFLMRHDRGHSYYRSHKNIDFYFFSSGLCMTIKFSRPWKTIVIAHKILGNALGLGARGQVTEDAVLAELGLDMMAFCLGSKTCS